MTRGFNRTDKNTLFVKAHGQCVMCGEPLDTTWEADHIVPYSLDGKTEINNGQALCSTCNKKKGTTVISMKEHADTIQLRKAQQEMVNVAFSKIQRGEKSMTCVLACGSGKTLGALNLCNALYRLGIITGAIFLTPREALCKQYQKAWDGKSADDFSQYYDEPKISGIYYRENKAPILFPRDFGYALIYNSLVADSKTKTPIHTDTTVGIVQRKFALILDEAQALSKEDEKAFTAAVRGLYDHPNCIFTMVMSATPIRSDDLELFCGEYTAPNENGFRYLKADVVYSYRDGVEQQYLRPLEFHLQKVRLDLQAWGAEDDEDITTVHSDEKGASKKLRQFMEQREVWQNLADKTVEELRSVRERFWMGYRALIAAIDVKHAGLISAYLRNKYPTLRALTVIGEPKAILEDDPHGDYGDLSDKLEDFKNGGYDILISVRKAYVGFNCPTITVVGVLTHWRFSGFLEQLSGRGGRVCKERPIDEQVLRVIGLDDPAMAQFAKDMREATLAYLIEKGLRSEMPTGSDVEKVPVVDIVTGTTLEGHRALGWNAAGEGDLTREQYTALSEFLRQQNLYGVPLTSIAQVINKSGGSLGVFLGNIPKIEETSFTYDIDVDAFRSAIKYGIEQLAGIYKKNGRFSSYEEAIRLLYRQYFPKGIDNFYRDFKSHSEYKAALGVKHAEIARTVMQEKRNKKEKK